MKYLVMGLFLVLISGCASTVILPDAKLKHDVVCGKDPCRPGNGVSGTLLKFTKDPVSPDVGLNDKPLDVAIQLVGKTVKRGDFTGRDPITCHKSEDSPFGEDQISLKSGSWKRVEYSKTETLSIDVNAAVSADINALKKIAPNINLTEIEAKLTAAYSSVSGSTLNVNAYYTEYGLTSDVIDAITRETDYKACKEFLKEYDRAIITDVGFIYFDITKDGESVEKIGADIEAELKQQGIDYKLGASIKREVAENMSSVVDAGYQVVAWRQYFSSDLEL